MTEEQPACRNRSHKSRASHRRRAPCFAAKVVTRPDGEDSVFMTALLGYRTPRYVCNRTRQYLYERRHPDAQWLTPAAIGLLGSLLRPTDGGAEFGSGRSTIWFAERVTGLTSIECVAANAPAPIREHVALRLLSVSPHYFYGPDVRVEDARNRESRQALADTLVLPYLTSDTRVLDYGCGPGYLAVPDDDIWSQHLLIARRP
jgi:hypothetical protein